MGNKVIIFETSPKANHFVSEYKGINFSNFVKIWQITSNNIAKSHIPHINSFQLL